MVDAISTSISRAVGKARLMLEGERTKLRPVATREEEAGCPLVVWRAGTCAAFRDSQRSAVLALSDRAAKIVFRWSLRLLAPQAAH